jgi:ferrous iron transport protein B
VLAGVGGVVIFLPQIIILFGFLGILEDCGYMARAAFLMDRIMSRCGLSGKSFIPLLSSLACAVPGILSTRVIENRRDRLATILVAPLMSCSARLPVYTLFSAAFFPDPWWLAGTVMFGLYATGFVVAPLVALILRGSLLKGDVPLFVLEMPTYRRPAIIPTLKRMWDAGTSFLYRAGTLILATMVLVWALLYFPSTDTNGLDFPTKIANANPDDQPGLILEWKEQSWLGRSGKALEPVFIPLGWDWRIGMSVLASFPAREVVVAALGVSFGEGEVGASDEEGRNKLTQRLKAATWPDGRPLFTTASALSLLVFFALCCQCASTLAVIARETRSIGWAFFTFGYMTTLAYAAALAINQIGRIFG